MIVLILLAWRAGSRRATVKAEATARARARAQAVARGGSAQVVFVNGDADGRTQIADLASTAWPGAAPQPVSGDAAPGVPSRSGGTPAGAPLPVGRMVEIDGVHYPAEALHRLLAGGPPS